MLSRKKPPFSCFLSVPSDGSVVLVELLLLTEALANCSSTCGIELAVFSEGSQNN
ncbi:MULTISPECIES: hypothetical protein [Wolbachia]|uniref:hypothetical protein n=1 Tax=Wolbachia TaxID=953 RepID=UPI00201FCF16|nr:hypothetical protein [Wolbachia endosymbiont of Ostrinia scapulalis]URG41219.1 hypothetical protein M1L26_000227 [Wolbachia endosymbiont of Ostrinia scapulalis]